MLRDWLRLFRAQTFSATLLLIMIGYLLAGGDVFSIQGFLLIFFAWTIHTSCFGDNSLMDAAMGYDQFDLGKKHHPLITGAIKLKTAHKVIHTYVALAILFGIFLVLISKGNKPLAMTALLIFVIGGNAYNKGLSKTSIFAFFPISVCFTSLMFFSYFLIAEKLFMIIILVGLYIFYLEWYEQGVEGYIKEINAEKETNMLRFLGAKCDSVFNLGLKASIYSWTIKFTGIFLLWLIVSFYNLNLISIIVATVFSFLMFYFAFELTKLQKWDRNKALRNMAIEEIVSIFALLLILIPLIDVIQTIFLVVFSFTYFILLNYINWGSFFAPKV